jgi:hypothetical protein
MMRVTDYSLLERLFGSRLISEIGELEEELSDCQQETGDLQSQLEARDLMIQTLNDTISSRDAAIENLEDEVVRVNEAKDAAEMRAQTLQATLEGAIQVPDLSALIGDDSGRVLFDPWNANFMKVKETNPTTGMPKMKYSNFHIADPEYYAFPKERWLEIMDVIKASVNEHLEAAPEIADCDNWANWAAFLVHEAFRRADLERNGAVMILGSHDHVYNGFIDVDGIEWVYDVMINESLIGKLGETPAPKYDTYRVWLTG